MQEFLKQLREHLGSLAEDKNLVTQVRGVGRGAFAVATLAPFNLIFVLIPYLAVLGCLVLGWLIIGASVAASLAGLFLVLSLSLNPLTVLWAPLTGGLFALGCLFFSLAACMAMVFVTQGFAKLTLRYLQWNLSFIIDEKQTKGGQA